MQNEKQSVNLGVNIDHIATLRQARGGTAPEPIQAALLAEQAGASNITVHLREDRRHIQERDVVLLKQVMQTRLNLEMAVSKEIEDIALAVKPHQCCLVPEKRQELTTEGGLDVVGNEPAIRQCCERLTQAGMRVALFIDPIPEQIAAAVRCGASAIELHTGTYANARGQEQVRSLSLLQDAVYQGLESGLQVNAGHGLDYHNVQAVASIKGISELNIGHAIIARAVMTGLSAAVQAMCDLINGARQ